jgi:hypothetical protein
MLDVPVSLIWFVSGLLAARRRSIGTRKKTRRLGCYRQALFGLAWFRDRGSIPRLGAGFGLSQATAYRYLGRRHPVRHPGRQDRRRRPVPRENPQPQGEGNRPVVLGKAEGLRREHPGRVLPGRPADVGL